MEGWARIRGQSVLARLSSGDLDRLKHAVDGVPKCAACLHVFNQWKGLRDHLLSGACPAPEALRKLASSSVVRSSPNSVQFCINWRRSGYGPSPRPLLMARPRPPNNRRMDTVHSQPRHSLYIISLGISSSRNRGTQHLPRPGQLPARRGRHVQLGMPLPLSRRIVGNDECSLTPATPTRFSRLCSWFSYMASTWASCNPSLFI